MIKMLTEKIICTQECHRVSSFINIIWHFFRINLTSYLLHNIRCQKTTILVKKFVWVQTTRNNFLRKPLWGLPGYRLEMLSMTTPFVHFLQIFIMKELHDRLTSRSQESALVYQILMRL